MFKKLFWIPLFFTLISCGEGEPRDYHGVKYHSYSDIITLPLVAFEDNTTRTSSGYFVVCFGGYGTSEKTKYKVLVEFPDHTMKIIEFIPTNIFIKYGDKPRMTSSLHGFENNLWWDEVTLEIPEGSVRYENSLDGE